MLAIQTDESSNKKLNDELKPLYKKQIELRKN